MTIDDFQKAELRVAKVLTAERVAGSEKLLKLNVELENATRQIIAGIGKAYEPEELVGKEIVVVANLDPRKFKIKLPVAEGEEPQVLELESNGMLLAAQDADGAPVLLGVDKEVPSGSSIQ